MEPTQPASPFPADKLAGLSIASEHGSPASHDEQPSSAMPPKRTTRQALSDVVGEVEDGEELIPGAPSRNGGRFLTEDRDPWTHNAWDQVEWGPAEEEFAQAALEKQRSSPVPQHVQEELNKDPAAQWDKFYAVNKDNFFKNRAWLQNEFPELAECLKADAGPKLVVEIGCGNGSTLFPLLAANENPQLELHGYDYSKEAVSVVRGHESFDPRYLTCSVWDLSSPCGPPPTVPHGTVDVLTMIFVFSALHPDEWAQAVENAWRMLKPGGILLFRDYGRNDLAMLRFKANRYMQDGLYVRGDNTRVYFFERDELIYLFGNVRRSTTSSAPATCSPPNSATPPTTTTTDTTTTETTTTTTTFVETPSGSVEETTSSSLPVPSPSPSRPSSPSPSCATAKVKAGENLTPFTLDLIQLGVDRRLLLNRKRQLKMMRVWLQGRWRKPLDAEEPRQEQ
ncbi:hypothetical protein JCM8547_004557 [Rhodosporidiobolus lusitaniae]